MTKRIDSHHHVWDLSRGDYRWITPADYPTLLQDFAAEDLAPHLQKYDIDYSVLVQAADTVAETEYMLSVAAGTNFIKGVVGWVDMSADDAPDVLAGLTDNPLFRGIRPSLMSCEDHRWILGPPQQQALRALNELGLVFDALVWPSQLDTLLEAMSPHPELGFVINHFGYPDIAGGDLAAWKIAMTRFARETDARVKFSGVLMGLGDTRPDDDFREVSQHLLDQFGPRRLMWGSDWPHLLADSNYDAWYARSLRLLEEVDAPGLASIYGDTAAAFYRV